MRSINHKAIFKEKRKKIAVKENVEKRSQSLHNLPVDSIGELPGLSPTFFLREKSFPNGDFDLERFLWGVPSFGKVLPDLEIILFHN